jgi:putative ABC transport system ATP-binding protein
MPAILAAENLRFLDILRFPPIAIEQGSVTFICGESGVGKSTLLKLFNATLSPAEGTIFFSGADIGGMEAIALRRQVLLAGQTVFLFDDTIRGNFEQFYAYRGEPCIGEDEMQETLRLCSLELPLTANCHTLSGGERQRVFLAIHLSMKPAVLMLDEPTSALDQKTSRQMLERLKEHCKQAGITLVVISHDRALASAFADAVIALPEGACG